MSKFNSNKNTVPSNSKRTVQGKKTINLAGGDAYSQSDKMTFASMLFTTFLNNKHYQSSDQQISELKKLISKIKDKKFLAKAAIYARDKMNMRSVSHVVAAEIAHDVKGEDWTKNFISKVVIRPDDMAEILAYYKATYNEAIPNCMKKGFAKVLQNLNEYSLAKYFGKKKQYSMIDIVNLVHPKSTPALDSMMNGTLKPAETWEVSLTQAGQNAEDEEDLSNMKSDVWKKMLTENKLKYFALLRNIRNIAEQAPECLDLALEKLVDKEMIVKSRVLPFRFTTAYKVLEGLSASRKIRSALNKAIEISLQNVPKFDGKTLVVIDDSGSMVGQPIEIASLLGAVLYKNNDADLMMFDSQARYVNLDADNSLLSMGEFILKSAHGGGTDFHKILPAAKKKYDRVFILSDMQGWIGNDVPTKSLNEYKKKFNQDVRIYSFDLQGYGTTQFPDKDIMCVAGFSENVFNIIAKLENDKNALINDIEKIEL